MVEFLLIFYMVHPNKIIEIEVESFKDKKECERIGKIADEKSATIEYVCKPIIIK